MRCTVCKKDIPSGAEARKMIAEYTQDDGTTKVFGYLMHDGELSAATGRLIRGWHHKCFHVVRKREARGDQVTGRVLVGAVLPTGYEIAELVDAADGTRFLSERVELVRAVARAVGMPVGDPMVTEAFRAMEHGGPYPHTHHLRLETYQLLGHLRYAHGIDFDPAGGVPAQQQHDELHAEQRAQAALEAIRDDRDADPGYTATEETDWREQVVTELNELQ